MDSKDTEEVGTQLVPTEELEEAMDTKVATQPETLGVALLNTNTPQEVEPRTPHAEESTAPEEAGAAGDVCLDGGSWTEDRRVLPADYSEDSDSSSSSSSSSSSPPSVRMLGEDEEDDEGFSQPAPVKTRDEVLLEELPAVEELCVSLPESAEIQPIGTVTSVIQQLIIVQSLKDTPPLTEDSIIFTSDRLAVGKVFEVFGPVSSPYYVLRFNSEEEIATKGLVVGCTVFYTPDHKEYTGYVLTKHLQNLKGSDASWKNDQEPPPEALDYSDDEEEQEAKKKKRQNTKKKKDNAGQRVATSVQDQQPARQNYRAFPPRSHGAPPLPFSHQGPVHPPQTPFQQQHPGHHPHAYLPPLCPYPPPPGPFPPHNFHLYPPPPPHHLLPPPHPSASSYGPLQLPPPPPWPPALHPGLHFSPPPPPPPPPPTH